MNEFSVRCESRQTVGGLCCVSAQIHKCGETCWAPCGLVPPWFSQQVAAEACVFLRGPQPGLRTPEQREPAGVAPVLGSAGVGSLKRTCIFSAIFHAVILNSEQSLQ